MSAKFLYNSIADMPNGGMVVEAFAIVVVIVVFVIAAVILDRRGLDFEVDGKALKVGLRRRVQDGGRSLRYKAAMARLGDLEQGTAALPGATEQALARCTFFCENIAWVLAVGTHHH